MAKRDVSFLTFFVMWAKVQGWKVPLLHVRICLWLESCLDPIRVLQVFRGAAKSTIYAVYKAWQLYRNPQLRALIWAADGPLSKKLTRDTINVLRRHPLCVGMLPSKPGSQMFWVSGALDARNASMTAVGVNQNVTSARADSVDYDDIEVPKNIKTPEAREQLRLKIQEAVFILVPGGQESYIGTPHTHDSIYPELIAAGAASLKIPLFESSARYLDTSTRVRYQIPFAPGPDGLYVMTGIHKYARLLKEGIDYRVEGSAVVFSEPPNVVLDIYGHCAWPERFTRDDIEKRRKKTRTLNYWDSQYQLSAKPIAEVRLDPEKIVPYDCEPRFVTANRRVAMWLGNVQIVGCSLRWDPSSGKLNSDVSAAVLDLQDAAGRHYWHRVLMLTGEVAETNDRGDRITAGQVMQLADLIKTFRVPRVTVETNGIGGFAPAFLKTALKQRRLRCGVAEVLAVQNKNLRIVEAIEPLLQSGMLWAHVSVLEGPLWDQAKDWNPAIKNQPDDLLDAGAGAVTDQPARIGQLAGNVDPDRGDDWRPSAGAYEAALEA
jgi:hypothetical protein